KPQNVMICERPNRPDIVKIVDFGIARSLSFQSEYKTQRGMVMGTPSYMSPEQANGDADLDARSDIFSLGLIVYQMLSGTLPFSTKGLTPMQQIFRRALLEDSPPPFSQICPDLNIPRAVEAAIMHALKPDRNPRTQSATQFIEEFEAACSAI